MAWVIPIVVIEILVALVTITPIVEAYKNNKVK